jgi:NAD(P)-dependent dehydrogenase (short-subunit alcohol dehydrogenase family)
MQPYKHVDFGFERNIAANYFGHFYLTQLLLDDLKASAPARVVNIASVGEAMGLRYMRNIPWVSTRPLDKVRAGQQLAAC